MGDGHGIFADVFQLAFGAVRLACLRLRHLRIRHGHRFHARGRCLQARLGIDQKLTGDDDFLPRLQTFADFRLAVAFHADLHVYRFELTLAFSHKHDTAFSRLDHGFGGHHQCIALLRRGKIDVRKHAGGESAFRVRELYTHFECARGGIDFGEYRADFSIEDRTRIRRRARLDGFAWLDRSRAGFRHLGVYPNAAEIIDAKQGGPGHHRHPFAYAQFGDDTAHWGIESRPRLHLAAALDQANLRLRHTNQHQTLARSAL